MPIKQRFKARTCAILVFASTFCIDTSFVWAKKGSKKRKDDSNEAILNALNGVCPLTCNEGFIPAPKLGYLPYSNGCTVPKFNNEMWGDYSIFEQCCNYHDVCYMTCGNTKKYCDQEYEDCMLKKCRVWAEAALMEQCEGKARKFAIGQKMYGCTTYRENQMEMCDCYEPQDAHNLVTEYAHDFFSVYNKTHMLPENVQKKYLDRKPDSRLHGELLYRLYKRYPEGIEIIASDGETKRRRPKFFNYAKDDTPDEDELENEEL